MMTPKWLFVGLSVALVAGCVSRADPAVSDYRRGLAAYSAGLSERAIGFFTASIDHGTLPQADLAVAYERRCAAQIAVGQFALAVEDCTSALNIDENFANALNGRCWAQARMDKFDGAVADCEKAVSLDRDDKSFAHDLGFVYEGLGNLEKAKSAYGQALALDPAYEDAREGLDRVTNEMNPS